MGVTMELDVKKTVTVKATTLRIHAKCSDMCSAELLDQDGLRIHESDGYVPGFMPGEHYGDYVILDIDIETGVIKNWKKPTKAAIQEWIGEEDGDD
jgi:hypothetical protein